MNQTPETTRTPADTLRAAASYLQQHGWVQGFYYGSERACDTPAACAAGAIARMVYGRTVHHLWSPDLSDLDDPRWSEFSAALAALRQYLAAHGVFEDAVCEVVELMFVGAWNDLDDQTAESVMTSLAEAADEWDHAHGGAA